MKVYTIIGGVNGTGKTSLTGVLKSQRNDLGYIIDVDKITAENNNNFITAGKITIKKIDDLLEKEISFTQETTLSGRKTLNTIQIARSKGYYIRLFYVGLSSVDESLRRIKNRVEKGGHHIDDKTVVYRFNNRMESLAKIMPYCNEIHFYDNENGFVHVAEYKNGQLTLKGDYVPQWLTDTKLI